jgi:predicted phage baseplate assembly protein
VGTARVTTASSQRWALRTVRDVQPDAPNDRTLVVLDRPLSGVEPTVSSADAPVVYLLRQRAALFGHNAPDWKAMSKEVRCMYDPPSCDEPPPAHATDWPGIGAIAGSVIDLDAVYPRVAPGSWLALEKAGKTQLYLVKGVATPSVSRFAMSAKVTRVSPDLTADLGAYGLRETTVYGQSEQVDLAEVAITSPLAAGVDTLTLAAATPDLPEGRQLLLAGLTPIGEQAGEIVQVKSVAGVVVTLEKPLLNSYERKSVVVYGNVAAATHGESRSEVLGSGDAGRVFQRFDLRNKPVTYRASDAASGSTSTLEVRVNSVAWQERPSFFERGRSDRVFITRLADDGATRVTFGDGVNGARLPAGVENITATYRVGSGLDGLVKPGQLSLLMTRPLGVKSVVNPLAPAGADDPETRDQARENAPITVLTFERIVSLADFENFARSFGGIAKAQAALLWQGEHRVVFVTVAGLQGAALPAGDPLLERLRSAIRKAGAVLVPFDLLSYESLSFALRAEIIPVEGFLTNEVMAAAQAAVQSAFSFEQRSLGQSVTRSEVIAAIQSAPGVQAVNLKAFHFTGDSPVADRGQAAPVAQRLIALPTRRSEETATVLPVQLIVVDPAQIELEPVTVFGK